MLFEAVFVIGWLLIMSYPTPDMLEILLFETLLGAQDLLSVSETPYFGEVIILSYSR